MLGIVSRARLSRGERVWSISHHHLVSNMPRISWRVNWVSDEWRCGCLFWQGGGYIPKKHIGYANDKKNKGRHYLLLLHKQL